MYKRKALQFYFKKQALKYPKHLIVTKKAYNGNALLKDDISNPKQVHQTAVSKNFFSYFTFITNLLKKITITTY